MMRLMILLLFISSYAFSQETCSWNNNTPCVVIAKSNITNSNDLGDKITPSSIITKKDIEKYNLIDLPKALNFIQGLDISQSGPTGQQGSVFFRGTNSNHVLVL